MDKKRLTVEPANRIGNIIPIGKVTLLSGLPGTGKTWTTIKFLNSEGITPLYFNLDYTEIGDLKAECFDNEALLELLDKKNDYKDLHGRTIILDTYLRFADLIGVKDEDGKTLLVKVLENLSNKYNATVIIIGHTEEYVGKDNIFNDNTTLVRNCYEHIYLETKMYQPRGQEPYAEHRMYIGKGRGYKGSRIIKDWMRD